MTRWVGPAKAAWGAVFAVLFTATACSPKNALEAESQKNVRWLSENPTGESIAALGRLADHDPRALTALEGRKQDVNAYVAAWAAVGRNAPWGTAFMKEALADPARAEVAASALPRKDPRLVAFLAELEGAVVRLGAGKRGSVLAGILASIGPQAHAVVERRLLDGKTRAAMCDGLGLPETSDDARALLLSVPAEGRDHPSCIAAVIDLATTNDAALTWIGAKAEAGLIGAVAKSALACPRVAAVWQQALSERAPDGAMTVPLQRSIARCGPAMDITLAELMLKTPRARATIVQAIDPFANETGALKQTCAALRQGYVRAEKAIVRERANDALANGCKYSNGK